VEKMVKVDEAIIARLKSHGSNFEILVDCRNAIAVREGKEIDMTDVLAAQDVFTDAKKGLRAPEMQLKQVFSITDPEEVAKHIISKGEIQLTSEYKSELRQQKRKKILEMIHRNGIDPKSGLPHPMTRLELAMDQSKIHIDEFGSVEKQVQDVLKAIREIIPIRFEKRKIEIKLTAETASKAYGALSQFGNKLKEEWRDDGSYVAVIEIPAGLQEELFDKLNKITQGNNETKVLKD
jgi:ribosome maturation protein SDO1